ncbi:MAG: glycoside hydrolase family 38 C-terminal domain-containing protein [Bacteroidota bacterium]
MKPTYHIVSHSHWDREWYKSFEQFRAMLVNMIDDLLDLLARDPGFASFTLDGQTSVVEDYLAVRPERREELVRYIKHGRILTGPWYVLPDEFLVSAESTVRNLMVGTTMARAMGGGMNVGYIPDSFGHIAMMPAILKGFGIDSALVYRGFGGEPDQKTSEYRWVAPDGTKALLIHLFRHGYSAGYFHQETEKEILERFKDLKADLDARATTSHRLMMNGGDHHWPDPKLPQTLGLLRKNFEGEFVHSNVPAYVEAVKKQVNGLPEVHGEMRFGYRYAFVVLGGTASSRMYLKQENWKAQLLMERYVEPLAAVATLAGMRSQQPLVRQGWKNLLQNHPHDSICGCSIDSVHREMMTRFKAVNEIGASVMETALQKLIPYDDQAFKDDRSLFLFNPSPFERSDVTHAEIKFYLQDIIVGLNPDVKVAPKLPPVSGFRLRDEQGAEVPYQVVARSEGYDITYTNYNYPKQTYADQWVLLVDAKRVPPVGFQGYTIERTRDIPRYSSSLKTGKTFLENDFLRVEVNGKGEVTLKDKVHKTVFSGLNVFEDSGDVGDEYTYSYPKKDRWIFSNKSRASVRIIEQGPLRATIQVVLVMRIPESATRDRGGRSGKTVPVKIISSLFLTPSSRSLEIVTTVENRAKDHRFRVLFPSGIKTDTVHADSQFCVVERRQKKYHLKEFTIEHPAAVAPMQRFVTVRNAKKALTLFSYGMPEYELKLDGRGTLALTLLRCVGLLAADDLITRPGGKSGWHNETPEAQCPGAHTFRYALLPHRPEEFESMDLINRESEKFHLPLFPVRRKNPMGLPISGSFVSVEPPQLVLSAIKEAENGKGTILRVYNSAGKAVEGTFRFTRPFADAWMARLDEEKLERVKPLDGQTIRVNVPPFGISTVRVFWN